MNFQRTVTVFLSCPGDLTRAKDELTKVVYEVGDHFRPMGIYVSPWRHDPQAIPGIGVDAQDVVARQIPKHEIYVGLLCRRLGTPTRRALSGTVEEFMDARSRYLDSGRPDILFYCCARPKPPSTPDEEQQFAKVREFRLGFPGYFSTFQTLPHLRRTFKDHLIDLLLREIASPVPRRRSWVQALTEALDNTGGTAGYLDRSSRFVCRIVEKIRSLVDLPTILNEDEIDCLLAACHLRAFESSGAADSTPRRILRAIPTVGRSLEESAVQIAGLAATRLGPKTEEVRAGNVRCTFLAALLQISEVLDLDHEAIADEVRPPQPPPENSTLKCWLAYCTRHINIRRPGLVRFQILIARGQERYRETLSRVYALIFEAAWQRLRYILTANGVVLSRAPLEVSTSATAVPLSESVLSKLELAAKDALEEIPELLHLSEAAPSWFPVNDLLPLPLCAILTELVIAWDPLRDCTVRLKNATGDEVAAIRATTPGNIRIPAGTIGPEGSIRRWELVEDFGDFQSTVANGEVRALTQSDRLRLEIGEGEGPLALQSWRFSLGLWSELLVDLWPKLVDGSAEPNEVSLVYGVILGSYDWLRLHSPQSNQIDRLRSAAQIVRAAFT
jgi:hypothetical protein